MDSTTQRYTRTITMLPGLDLSIVVYRSYQFPRIGWIWEALRATTHQLPFQGTLPAGSPRGGANRITEKASAVVKIRSIVYLDRASAKQFFFFRSRDAPTLISSRINVDRTTGVTRGGANEWCAMATSTAAKIAVAPIGAVGFAALHFQTTCSSANGRRVKAHCSERAILPSGDDSRSTQGSTSVTTRFREHDFSGPMGRVELVRTATIQRTSTTTADFPTSVRRGTGSEARCEEQDSEGRDHRPPFRRVTSLRALLAAAKF